MSRTGSGRVFTVEKGLKEWEFQGKEKHVLVQSKHVRTRNDS